MERDLEVGVPCECSVHDDLLERIQRLEDAKQLGSSDHSDQSRLSKLSLKIPPAPGQYTCVASSASLGLFGFGFTTMLLSFVNVGIVDATTGGLGFIVSFMFFYGGVAQMLAGIMAFIRRDMLAATAFSSYGSFWIAEGLTQVLLGQSLVTAGHGFEQSAVVALSTWAVITFAFVIASVRKPLALQLVFLSLTLTFVLLAAGVYHPNVQKAGGGVGILTACLAIYTGACDLVLDALDFRMPGMKCYFAPHVE